MQRYFRGELSIAVFSVIVLPSHACSLDEGSDVASTGIAGGNSLAFDDGEEPYCGDGIRDPGEQCDDGEANSSSATCKTDCTLQVCGDGHKGVFEVCDDGNLLDGDGCSSLCSLEICGNGFVDVDEECDDDNSTNTDACLDTCVMAACGDGVVWAGVEECDDGNSANSDSCVVGCVPASCGDGYLRDIVEDCDDGNQISGDGCSVVCTIEKLVFVTSSTSTGNIGGLAAADNICQSQANNAGLSGTYLAWLSTDSTSPAVRFTWSPYPYVMRNGVQVADDWDDLTDGSLDAPIDTTASGNVVGGIIWTTTLVDGTSGNPGWTCSNWTSTANSGVCGNASYTNGNWTAYADFACYGEYRFYCFQQ